MNKKYYQLVLLASCSLWLRVTASAGSLDTTFNPSGSLPGTVTTDIGSGNDTARGVVIQPDGKIVTVGFTNDPSSKFAVARYNSDGSLDTTFGVAGKVITAINALAFGNDVALQPDGKIVVTGNTFVGATSNIAVARYNVDGTLDTSFNGTGTVTTPIGSFAQGDGVAIQPDGKIVVGGAGNGNQFSVVRYNTDGSLDLSFGGSGTGIRTTPIGTSADGNAIVLQPDGKIIVAGSALVGAVQSFALARYNNDGTIDSSFGVGGSMTTAIGVAFSVGLQSDGKIILVGQGKIARYTTNGFLDSSFGTSGIVTQTPTSNSVVVQPDDKIVVVGGNSNGFVVIRYTPNGSLDGSFGVGGVTITLIGPGFGAAAVALQTDRKIVVVGQAVVSGFNRFAVARYNGDPTTLACALRLINKYGPLL